MMNTNPMAPFSTIVNIIIRGTLLLASFVSSDKCTAASEPANEPVAVIDPTKHAAPMEDQPPKFSNVPNTSLAGAFGARTQSGIIMQKKPKMCTIRTMPSRTGRCLAPYVFMRVPMTPIPIIRRDWCPWVCQRGDVYIEKTNAGEDMSCGVGSYQFCIAYSGW